MKKISLKQLLFIGLLLCLLVSLGVTACTQSTGTMQPTSTTAGQPQYGGVLRVGYANESTTLGYPPKITNTTIVIKAYPVLESLFRYNENAELVPWLASDIKIDVANNTITIPLKKGVKFHDGTDFNADAVKWNLDQSIAAKTSGALAIKSVDIVDDYTVRINLNKWSSTFTSGLAEYLGLMISPTACKTNGVDWATLNPVGTGPFKFVSWTRDAKTIYSKFDGYWQKGKPYVDSVEWNIIVNATTRELSFRSGEVDVLLGPNPESVDGLRKDGYTITVKKKYAYCGCTGLVFSSNNPKSPWSNLKVRQAAQYAVDTKGLVNQIKGQGTPANQFPVDNWAMNPSVVGYPYDPAKAKQLMAEAGYPDGFKTNMYIRQGSGFDDSFVAVQAYLKAIGVDASINTLPAASYDPMWNGGTWDGLLQNLMGGSVDVLQQMVNTYGGPTYSKAFTQMIAPDDYVQAFKNGIAAPDFAAKQKYTQEAVKLMTDKYCMMLTMYMPWFGGPVVTALSPSVHDVNFATLPFQAQWTPENAWLEKKK